MLSKKPQTSCFDLPNVDTNGVNWTNFEVDCSP